MKPILCLFAVLFLFTFSLVTLQAKTPGEINNFLKQAPIPELQGDKISVTKALAAVDEIVGLHRRKIALDIAVPQKADQTKITLNLKGSNAYDAIKTICELSGLQFTFKKDQILIY